MVASCSGEQNFTVNHSPVDFSAQLEKAPLSLTQPDGKASYDIIEVYNTVLVEYASKGWLAPLDDWAAGRGKDALADVDPGLLEKLSYEGTLYAIPNQQNIHILMYRKDIFDDLGLKAPKTYPELFEAADKIKSSGTLDAPFVASFNADSDVSTAFNNALVSNGGAWLDESSGKPTLATAEGVAAIEDLRKLKSFMVSSAMTLNNAKAVAELQNGRAAMGIVYAGRAATLVDPKMSQFSDNFAFAPAPAAKEGGPPAAQWTQDGFSVAKNSPVETDALADIISTTLSDEAQRAGAPVAIISRTSLLNDPGLKEESPYWEAALATVENGAETLPLLPQMPTIQSATRPLIVEAITGSSDPMDALKKADAAATTALKRAGFLE